jgi:TolB-like protein
MKRVFLVFIISLFVFSSFSKGKGEVVSEEETEIPIEEAADVAAEWPAKEAEDIMPPEEETGNLLRETSVSSAKASEGSREKIALFPLENLTDNREAMKYVVPVLIGQLEKRGLEIVDENSLNEFLCKERIRSTGYVSRELALKIREKFMAKGILAGSIISFSTESNPRFGLLVRLIDTSNGAVLWADHASATGSDFTTILGFGRLKTIFSLIPKVIEELFAAFSIEMLYRETDHNYKIAVMPFLNNSDFKNAGTIVTYMFLAELFKNGRFEPVEYGNIRKLIVDIKIREKGELDYNTLQRLSSSLEASGILIGVVDYYSHRKSSSLPPKVAITARLLDGRKNKIIWYNNQHMSGDDGIIALDWGRIRSVHTLANKVVSQLVKKMEKASGP